MKGSILLARIREDCLEEVQESWVCSSNDREHIQVKKAHLEGIINKDNMYSVGTCRFYAQWCICISSFKSYIDTKVATIIIPISKNEKSRHIMDK